MRSTSDGSTSYRTGVYPRVKATTKWWATLLLLVTVAASAQEGLYGPEAPRGAAYLRLLNATQLEVTFALDGDGPVSLAAAEATSYTLLEPGAHSLTIRAKELALSLEPASFITVAILPNGPLVLADTPLRDISRGVLALYNLTEDATLSLSTASGSDVLPDVPPRSQASVEISEAEVELVVSSSGEAIASLPATLYRRGEAHSIVVLPIGSDPQVVYVRAGAEH